MYHSNVNYYVFLQHNVTVGGIDSKSHGHSILLINLPYNTIIIFRQTQLESEIKLLNQRRGNRYYILHNSRHICLRTWLCLYGTDSLSKKKIFVRHKKVRLNIHTQTVIRMWSYKYGYLQCFRMLRMYYRMTVESIALKCFLQYWYKTYLGWYVELY